MTQRLYEHIQYTGDNDLPLNGLLRHPPASDTPNNKAVVFVHGAAGKPLGGHQFYNRISDALYGGGIAMHLVEYGGTDERAWYGNQKAGATSRTVESSVADVRAAVHATAEAGYSSLTLVGHSLGSTICAAVAAEHSQTGIEIEGVGLLAPTYMPIWTRKADPRYAAHRRTANRAIAQGQPDYMVTHHYSDFDMPLTAEALVSLASADVLPHLVRLGEMRLPTLVMYGSDDQYVFGSWGEFPALAIRRAHPYSFAIEVFRSDHSFSIHEPWVVADTVRRFATNPEKFLNAPLPTDSWPLSTLPDLPNWAES